jgi:ATP-binding cassette subfamily C protein CydD
MTSPSRGTRGSDQVEPSKLDLIAWLQHAARPGRAAFRGAARAATVATGAVVLGWAAVAYAVGLLVHQGSAYARLIPAVLLLAAAGAVRAVAQDASRRMAQRGGKAVATALRQELLPCALPGAGTAPLKAVPSGSQAAHAVIDLSDQVASYHQRTQPARYAAGPSSALVFLVVAVLHWPVAVLLALSTPFLPANMRLAGMATEDAGRRQLDEVRQLSRQLLDRFRGMRTLVTLGAVERERRVVQQASDSLNRATTAVLRRAFVVAGILDAVVTCSIAVCATYVGLVLLGYLHLPGTPGLGFVAGLLVLVLCPVYFAPLREHASGYHERDEALAAAAILAIPLSGPAGRALPPAGAPVDRSTGRLRFAPSVELDRLTVAFAGAERAVLDETTVLLPAGGFAVLAAPSGEGKSTLLRVVAGLQAPTSGTVRLRDPATGRSLAPRPGRASWIGQQTVLLAGTLAYNIGLGAPSATPTEIERAAGRAGLDALITRLPDGLATEVGERGWGVSAGEARRVALARALLRDAPLWILDEPTAHLDSGTERELLDSILSAAAGRTVLMASHSSALLDRADLIWRLDRGSVRVSPAAVR